MTNSFKCTYRCKKKCLQSHIWFICWLEVYKFEHSKIDIYENNKIIIFHFRRESFVFVCVCVFFCCLFWFGFCLVFFFFLALCLFVSLFCLSVALLCFVFFLTWNVSAYQLLQESYYSVHRSLSVLLSIWWLLNFWFFQKYFPYLGSYLILS